MDVQLHWSEKRELGGVAFTANELCGDGTSLRVTGRVIPFRDHLELHDEIHLHLPTGERLFPADTKIRDLILAAARRQIREALDTPLDESPRAVAAWACGFTRAPYGLRPRGGAARRSPVTLAAYGALRARDLDALNRRLIDEGVTQTERGSHLAARSDSAAAEPLAAELGLGRRTIVDGFKAARGCGFYLAGMNTVAPEARALLDADGRDPVEIVKAGELAGGRVRRRHAPLSRPVSPR